MLTTALCMLAAASASASPLRANTGSIQSLTAQGAVQPGDPISVSSSVLASDTIVNSNLYYELFDPNGTRVDTHQTNLGRLDSGGTASDSWQSSNTPSTGSYTVTLCWSTGNSHNCDIDMKTTQFSSVPTLGWPLTMVAVGLLGAWLWRRREVWVR